MRPLAVHVQYASRAAGLPREEEVIRWARATRRRVAAEYEVTLREVTVRYVDRREGRTLNAAFRGKDYATNVLTFVLSPEQADIVICAPVVGAEARREGKPLAHHHAHMVVHGVLHALGFDHGREEEARVMEAIEVAVLHRFAIKNPYELLE